MLVLKRKSSGTGRTSLKQRAVWSSKNEYRENTVQIDLGRSGVNRRRKGENDIRDNNKEGGQCRRRNPRSSEARRGTGVNPANQVSSPSESTRRGWLYISSAWQPGR